MTDSRENSEENLFRQKQRSSFIHQNEEVLISTLRKGKVKPKPLESDYKSSAVSNKSTTTNKRKIKIVNYVKRKAQLKGVSSWRSINIKPCFSLVKIKLALNSIRQFVRYLYTQKKNMLAKILEFLSDEILLSIFKTVSHKKLNIFIFLYLNQINSNLGFIFRQQTFNDFLLKYSSTITKKLRFIMIKNINTCFSNNIFLSNSSFISNVKVVYFANLSLNEQNKVTKNLCDNLEKILKFKNACELLEEIILSYPKELVHSIKISLIKNSINIVRTSNGMFALIKTILSESLEYQNFFKTNSQSLTSLTPFITNDCIPNFYSKNFFSQEELNELSLRKNVFKTLINEIITNFSSFIVIRNGSVVINHLLSSLLIQPELSDLLIEFLEKLSIEDVLEVSCYKYSNKIVENLLCFPIFNKRLCNFFYLEKEALLDIQNSALFFLCSKFRGINILDKVLEEAELYDGLRLFKDLQKISKCGFLQDKHYTHIKEILERKKTKFSDKNLEKTAKLLKQAKVLNEKIRLIKNNGQNLITAINKVQNVKEKKNNTDKIKYRIPTSKEKKKTKKCSSDPSINPFILNNSNTFQLETLLNSNKKTESAQGFINNNFINNIQNNFSFMYPIFNSNTNNNNFNNYNSASNNNINSYQQLYNPTQTPLNYNKLHYNNNNLNLDNNFNNKNFINNTYNNNIDIQPIFNPYENNYNCNYNYNYNYNVENSNNTCKSIAYNNNFDFDCNVNYNILNNQNNNSSMNINSNNKNSNPNNNNNNNINDYYREIHNSNYINSSSNSNSNLNNFSSFNNFNNQCFNQNSFAMPFFHKNLYRDNSNHEKIVYTPNNYTTETPNEYNSTLIRSKNNLNINSYPEVKFNNTASTQNVVVSQKQSMKSTNKEKDKESFCNQVFPEGIFNIHTEDETLNIDNVNKKTK